MSVGHDQHPTAGECVAPVLPMRDADATAAFYGKLGFSIRGRYGEPVCDYLILRSAWIELHFYLNAETDPLTNASGAYVRTRDVDALTAGFATHIPPDPRGTPRFLPAVAKPWGMKQAILVDLDGNLVQFGTPLDQLQPARSPATSGALPMFIAMNRFKVVKGEEAAFEQIWSSRKTRLDEMPGFQAFHLLKGPSKDDHTLYASHTIWATKEAFTAWTKSEQFRESHRNAGQPRERPLYLGHPDFEGFEAVLSETNPNAPRRQAAE